MKLMERMSLFLRRIKEVQPKTETCRCGHGKHQHIYNAGECTVLVLGRYCNCGGYTPNE